MPTWLLAVDLDGTLLRADDTIADVDLAALERARAEGAAVVITTGRFPLGALAVARRLGAVLPVICADGAAVLELEGGVRISRCRALARARALARLCREHELKVFEFNHEALYYDEVDAGYASYVTNWSRGSRHRPAARAERVLMSLGLGDRTRVERVLHEAGRIVDPNLKREAFELAPATWAVKFCHVRASKGLCVLRVARGLGVLRSRIAAVGNAYNDVSLFRVAARSFCMGDAPLEVRQSADVVLAATGASGGGVAEAIADLL